ncbi:MAG: c-type cytochrome [Rhodobacteraceae bacterium]|nr:c-type cytochrome [Paracoccaceae bacterium]
MGRKILDLLPVLVVCALPACADEQADVKEGEALYRTHCATCHGIEATGHGPMAGVLVIKPTDLSALARDNGGNLPVERVVRRIDGRDPLVSHGSPMPVYGHFFEGRQSATKTKSGQPILASKPIIDLIAYIETLQAD